MGLAFLGISLHFARLLPVPPGGQHLRPPSTFHRGEPF